MSQGSWCWQPIPQVHGRSVIWQQDGDSRGLSVNHPPRLPGGELATDRFSRLVPGMLKVFQQI